VHFLFFSYLIGVFLTFFHLVVVWA